MRITNNAKIEVGFLYESENLRLMDDDTLECINLIEKSLILPDNTTFSRPTPKYKKDGTAVLANVPTYEAGKFANGVHIEEATVNLLTANQSSVETDTTGFAGISTTTIICTTEEAWEGTHSIKATGGGVSNGVATVEVASLTNAIHTASAYVKGDGQAYIRLRAYYTDGTYTETSGVVFTLDSVWERKQISHTPNTEKTIRGYLMQIRGNSTVIYADGFQIEQKAYATSWQIGGTPRVADSLYYDLPQPLPNEWFMSGVWVPDQASTISRANAEDLAVLHYNDNNRLLLNYYPPDDKLYFVKVYNGTEVSKSSVALSFSAGQIIEWAFAQLTQAHGNLVAGMHIWYRINGGAVVHVNNTDVNLPTAPTKAYIGCRNTTGYEANGVIDAVKLVDIVAAEAGGVTINNAWAEAHLTTTIPPRADVGTIILFNFDNLVRITPTKQIICNEIREV